MCALDNSLSPLLSLKLLRPQGQVIDVKCKKWQEMGHFIFFQLVLSLSEDC